MLAKQLPEETFCARLSNYKSVSKNSH